MGVTRGYRVVSEEEFADVLKDQRFKVVANSLEGKWFADNLESAVAHGRALYLNADFRLIEADLPDDAPSLFRHPNIDNKGPGRYLAIEDLGQVIPRSAET